MLYGRHHELIVITEPEVSPEIVVWSSLPEVSPHYVPINKLSLTQLYYTMQTLVKKMNSQRVSCIEQEKFSSTTIRTGNAYPSGAHDFTPGFEWGSC